MKFRWFETGLKAFCLLDLVLTYTRVGSHKGTSNIPSLCGNMRFGESLYSDIFYAVLSNGYPSF